MEDLIFVFCGSEETLAIQTGDGCVTRVCMLHFLMKS